CQGDEQCGQGLLCRQAGGQNVCLTICAGNCNAGYTCDGEVCAPDAGRCDPCNGACGPPTPVCIEATGQCGECDIRTPCDPGLVCDPGTNTCVEEGGGCECVADRDCDACLGSPICFRGRCVACLEDADCPPRFACSQNQQCIRAPCAGVACQRGAQCDPQSGTCVGQDGRIACQAAQDCADPISMNCNQETGQCFYTNGTCDPPGGDGVCQPGGNCEVNPLFMTTYCTCKKVDPIGMPFGPDLIPCHPGGVCLHGETFPMSGEAAPAGACLMFGM
ncbi:MAG: hypothetical protein KC620_05855, partial [Myxococcales bacterium]|nr:hypothetical protein [Myxococcales bacterium]